MEVSLGLLVLVALAILAYIATETGHLKGIAFQMRTTVVFDNAAGLVEGAAVRVAGVQVGRVEKLAVDFNKARATLLIDGEADVRQDAVVTIRARSLLGEKYVELVPNSPDAPVLADGMELKALPAGLEIDQVMSELGPLLKTLDVKEVGPLLSELKGTVQDNRANLTKSVQQLTDLLGRLETVEFDDPALQGDIKALAHNLRELSERLPGTLERTEKTLQDVAGKVTPVLERIDAAVAKLEPTLEKLPGTVDRMNAALEGFDKVMDKAGPLLTRAESINYDLMKKLLREEGLLIRFRGEQVEWPGSMSSAEGQGVLRLEMPSKGGDETSR